MYAIEIIQMKLNVKNIRLIILAYDCNSSFTMTLQLLAAVFVLFKLIWR